MNKIGLKLLANAVVIVGLFEFAFHIRLLQSGIPGRNDNEGNGKLPMQR
ncbi:hypothetical protein QWJ34_07885 [Saccharibacillus sp. CPCC 101409]|nr:hypothetical protein [Saccharibacillus sp. CPCC 101409]MDO3409681.1 hypothetical protein [Saccharibacillus sp. CPCC 101409]